ncbi:endolytic transglycosylase MltG [Psychrobacter cryohalolentis]|uniref:Endolytic murein transglycosylase n=1 Tax=Psychrobacter cryohalolentis (strain ATCC BAA-1226 / DSM 17306 / VKM B-2378 / K5) TaxID=335284 RepID=Q1QEG5_PSYCK|nr:endolytic transglycosylase MltG [Psychrobacter cryohalolentis]ABE73938.1 aminodeoxychorismate lyase [Psychrobacter cryohalolentis K5]ASE26575.1 endolytic transglycosylase MltG [Psychrobacter cryohalolentis]
MSTPTPETPPERPDDTLSNDQKGTADERIDGVPLNSKPVDETGVEEVPPTDVSLISGNNKPRHYKADNPSFFMQRGYQVLLVLGLIAAFFLVMVYQTLFGRIEQPQQMVTIEKGQTYYGLLPQWQQEIPLFSATIAKLYMKTQVDGPLHAGIYQLPENPTIAEALHVLGQGVKAAMVKVQIIEGKTSKDLYQALRDNKGIKKEVLTADSTNASIAEALDLVGILPDAVANSNDPIVNHNLEGWFAPDTYYYGEGTTDKKVLTDLYKRQQQALTKAWENRAPNLPYQTPYEALVMASIIEKETSVAAERPLVSAVFNNRLNKNMRMQTDPTIIYGMGSRYEGNIRRKDIDEKTGYNTYQIDGLPPTPIALPSAASIEATLHPADSAALYFVATGNGGHKFTNSLAEHNQAVKEYLGVMREKKAQTPQQ